MGFHTTLEVRMVIEISLKELLVLNRALEEYQREIEEDTKKLLRKDQLERWEAMYIDMMDERYGVSMALLDKLAGGDNE